MKNLCKRLAVLSLGLCCTFVTPTTSFAQDNAATTARDDDDDDDTDWGWVGLIGLAGLLGLRGRDRRDDDRPRTTNPR